MSKRTILILFALLAIALTGCVQRASTPVPTATLDPNFPAVATASGMQIIMEAGTQTAIAEFGTPEGGQGQPAAQTDVTPDPNAPQAPAVDANATPAPVIENPTPQPAITVIPAGAARPASYTLQKGEFPFCIARRFNVDPDELLALNGLTRSQSYFSPGTVLKIPQAGKAFPGERALLPHPTTYTVLKDDTIYSIACKFGDVDPLAIASQNGLQPPYALTVGSQITIP